MFNFIHKKAIENYNQEIEELINIYSSFNKEQIADFFIYSVWTRAGLQNEGHFKLPNGERNLSPSVDYSMLSSFNDAVNIQRKQNFDAEATALSIWVHTARGVVNIELKDNLEKLWNLIMSTKEFWNEHLNNIYNNYRNKLDFKELDKTFKLSKEILNSLPPKYE